MKKIGLYLIILMVLHYSCTSNREIENTEPQIESNVVKAADLSFVPQMRDLDIPFYNNGIEKDVVEILKAAGMNTVRIRIWVNPVNQNSSFQEVKQFASELKNKGLKTWLCVHYSDTWADPGHQITPLVWQNIDFSALKDSVYRYTQNLMNQIHPDYIQIGNEINNGMLLPVGDRFANPIQFKALLQSGIEAVRQSDPNCKIMIHYAGFKQADAFYQELIDLDYDIIALSYYPYWHGMNIDEFGAAISQLKSNFNKEVMLAETAYPFTLSWADQTNNIIGDQSQLILPYYPATPNGQRDFLKKIREICQTKQALGYCYWGAEYIAFDGVQSQKGSSWENQTLFNFKHELLPAAQAFYSDSE